MGREWEESGKKSGKSIENSGCCKLRMVRKIRKDACFVLREKSSWEIVFKGRCGYLENNNNNNLKYYMSLFVLF